MRSSLSAIILLLCILILPASCLAAPIPIPPHTAIPTDLNSDGVFEDVNGNGRQDFADVVLYFNQMSWIAANEPVAAFDYNGNGRIDFADVVWLFNSIGAEPSPVMTPTPLPGAKVTQVVNPSLENQTVRLDASVGVTIPGGFLQSPQMVTIERKMNPPVPSTEGDRVLNAVEVKIGDLHTLDQEVIIELPYDPSLVPAGTDPNSVLQGAYWDTNTSTWVPLPSIVDPSRHVIKISTRHLSLFSDMLKAVGLITTTGDHFIVYYDPNDDAFAAAFSKERKFNTSRQMAGYCYERLDAAYDEYVGLGFLPPEPDPADAVLDGNKVKVFIGRYEEAGWSPKTGRIYISIFPEMDEPNAMHGLNRELRHELFHSVQNQYYTWASMLASSWWMEATAEYISTPPGEPNLAPPLTADYFSLPITSSGKGADRHEYKTARVVNQLVYGDPTAFYSLWIRSTEFFSPLDGVGDWCLNNGNNAPLSTRYRDLALSLYLFTDDPSNPSAQVQPSIVGTAISMEDINTFTLSPGGGGTTVISPVLKMSTKKKEGQWTLAAWEGIQESLPEGCLLTTVKVHPDGTFSLYRSYGSSNVQTCVPMTYLLNDGDIVLFMCVNTGSSDATIPMAITQPDVTIDPADSIVELGDRIDYTIKVDHVPFNMPITVLDTDYKVVSSGSGSMTGTATLPAFSFTVLPDKLDGVYYVSWDKTGGSPRGIFAYVTAIIRVVAPTPEDS